VVRAKDTPNFIANRVGIAGMLATIQEAEKFGLSYDVVDDLTGKKMGRASSGTFRTADVVGLDTMAHVIKTLQDNLQDDPFFPSYATPPVLAKLIAKGALGQKTGAGFYKKVGKDILRLDPAKGDYVPAAARPTHRRPHPEEARRRAAEAAARVEQPAGAVPVGHPARQLPLRGGAPGRHRRQRARRRLRDALGLRHEAGPVRAVAGGRLAAGGRVGQGRHRRRQGAVRAPLPAWVFDGRTGVHTPEGSWSAGHRASYVPRSTCRSTAPALPRGVLGGGRRWPLKAGTEVFKNDEMRVWTLDGEVLIASITAKLHLIGPA
jgi:3-hydroxyacyl-CoA dehydrogenase